MAPSTATTARLTWASVSPARKAEPVLPPLGRGKSPTQPAAARCPSPGRAPYQLHPHSTATEHPAGPFLLSEALRAPRRQR